MHHAVGQAVRIFTRSLYDLMNQKPLHVRNWHLALDDGALSELRLWQTSSDRLHGAPLWLDPHVPTVLFTDAGAQGWGGFQVEHGKGLDLAGTVHFGGILCCRGQLGCSRA